MATLIYSPAIKVHVNTASGILDLSDDITSWQLDLRENAVHTFAFTLQNAARKYDGKILPMDQISVGLKRINWLQNFTGYLNDGSIFQAWPGTLDLTASCTLKIPQFLYWDPDIQQSLDMITKSLQPSDAASQAALGGPSNGDPGLQALIVNSLTQVVKWDKTRIHIGQIPSDWYTNLAEPVAAAIQKDTAIYQQLGGIGVINGEASGSGAAVPPGTYGSTTFDATQTKNASTILNTVAQMKPARISDISIMTLMCAMQESSLRVLYNPTVTGSQAYPNDGVSGSDHDSVGLFQQRVIYYGGVQAAQDPITSTQAFVTRLLKKVNNAAPFLDYGAIIQSVQGSADPTAYSKWQGAATALYASWQKLSAVTPATSNNPPFGTTTLVPTGTATTGSMVANVAASLIAAHTTSPIIYAEGGDDPDSTEIGSVKTLDCSSLVDWVFYHAAGKHLYSTGAGRSTAASIQSQAIPIPVDLAANIQGAVLFVGKPAHHVGISLGDGKNHVAAHMPYSDPTKDVNISPIEPGNGFNYAGLLPGVDYTGAAGNATAATQLQAQLKLAKTPTVAPPVTGDEANSIIGASDSSLTNPLQALVNGLYFNAGDDSVAGNVFTGPLALINDQPFLPWLQSLVNSSMRSFCSAPNGDFIAWFPDYFGKWGTAAVMNIEPIELQDFTVYWSDQQIVTHQYVMGNPGATAFDGDSGGVGYQSDVPSDLASLALGSSGLATMDYPEIFDAIYGTGSSKTKVSNSGSADSGFISTFLDRFGARPDVQQMPYIAKGQSEFFMALYLFIQRWAAMFTASIPLTFMPELFPGMLIKINLPTGTFQAYVQGVTHSGSFGEGGGFTTTVDVCAPSVSGGAGIDNTLLTLLPRSGPTPS